MTLEAQTQFNALADRLGAAKAAQKAALAALGRTPTDVWDTYPDELRAVTGGTGNYQESKTVTADPAGMTILPDEGYSGMLKAIIAAEPNFQPWNLVDGIEAWGITGTAKPSVSTAPPTNLPVDKDDADTAYGEQTGAAPTETDYFVCVDNDGNITYWYLSDDFTITSYDPITTEFKATGAIRMAYHTTGESVGTWTLDEFTSAESGGWNYLKNIRSCTREKLYYNDVEVWPVPFENVTWETTYNNEITTFYHENDNGFPWEGITDLKALKTAESDYPYLYRITIDNKSRVEYVPSYAYPAGTAILGGRFSLAGNKFLQNEHDINSVKHEDDGFDLCICATDVNGMPNRTYFYTREEGTYKVKIEVSV